MKLNQKLMVTPWISRVMLGLGLAAMTQAAEPAFRPPSVPLITCDPFLSIWSDADKLTDVNPHHWTHREQSLVSLIRIDGQTYRLMGAKPADIRAFPQVGLEVKPTRTIYQFDDQHVHVVLTFMQPALPEDLDVFGLPLTYLTWQVSSVDGARHEVALFDSTSSQLTVTTPDEVVTGASETAGKLTALHLGTVEQPVLGSAGDDHQLDWGYAYAAALTKESSSAIGSFDDVVKEFVAAGKLSGLPDTNLPRAVNQAEPVMAFAFDLGSLSAE
ncbi:MAG TPA: DUF5127 domain-containing protein, partial [Verrucomicrobiae bacterium]